MRRGGCICCRLGAGEVRSPARWLLGRFLSLLVYTFSHYRLHGVLSFSLLSFVHYGVGSWHGSPVWLRDHENEPLPAYLGVWAFVFSSRDGRDSGLGTRSGGAYKLFNDMKGKQNDTHTYLWVWDGDLVDLKSGSFLGWRLFLFPFLFSDTLSVVQPTARLDYLQADRRIVCFLKHDHSPMEDKHGIAARHYHHTRA